MKRTKLDRLGRIVIPMSYRKELEIGEGSEISIELVDRKIIVCPFNDKCRLCGKAIRDGKIPVCSECREMIINENGRSE